MVRNTAQPFVQGEFKPQIITLQVLVTTFDALGHFLNRIIRAQSGM